MNAQDRSGRDVEKKGMNGPDPVRKSRGGPLRAHRAIVYCPGTGPRGLTLADLSTRRDRHQIRLILGLSIFLVASTGSGSLAQSPGALASNRVHKVIDVDTVDLIRGGTIVRCRLIGLDGPESTTKVEPYGPEATSYLRVWIEGKVVRVDYERRIRGEPERDRYGRLLVYLFADRGRQHVNLILIERGFARFERRYPTRYRSAFAGAEEHARHNALGLWNPAYLPVGDPTLGGAFPIPRYFLTRRQE